MTNKRKSKTKTETKTNVTAISDLAAAIGTDHSLTVIDKYQDVKGHGNKIKASWQKAVIGIIETGQLLIEAKAALPHGRFTKLFDKEIGDLPFGKETAQRLMKVARNKVLTNAAYTPFLPACWYTLSTLSRAPDEQLERWILDGSVHPELRQLDAIKLVNPSKTAPEPTIILPDLTGEEAEAAGPSAEEAVQLNLELDNEMEERRRNNEEPLKKLDTNSVVQLLRNIDDRLNDPEIDWDKVIEAAGPALIGDILDELKSRLQEYKQAAEEAAAEATLH
jgi:hypothetical protein